MLKIIYYHLAILGNWKVVWKEFCHTLIGSKLFPKITQIRVSILGKIDVTYLEKIHPKIKVIQVSPDLSLMERFTLLRIHQNCQALNKKKQSALILYLHSKGVTKSHSLPVRDWRRYLLYFNITRFSEMTSALIKDEFSAMGVNLRTDIKDKPHFSGNYWWAQSDYLASLPPPPPGYYQAEFWIGSIGTRKAKLGSIWQSKTKHYRDRYLPHMYQDQKIYPIVRIKNIN